MPEKRILTGTNIQFHHIYSLDASILPLINFPLLLFACAKWVTKVGEKNALISDIIIINEKSQLSDNYPRLQLSQQVNK